MEKLHELSRTTVLRSRDPAHSRVLTPEKTEKSDMLFPVPKLPAIRLNRSSVVRPSAHALNPKLPKMMVQMLIHQRRPFLRSQRPEKEVRMLRACPRPARCKAVNEFS